jgi:hypothetical protein
MSNTGLIEIAKPTKDEKDFCRRIQTHFKRGLQVFFVCILLTAAVLIGGEYLSARIDVNAQSFIFQLWPFNTVYLKQFVAAPYPVQHIGYPMVLHGNLVFEFDLADLSGMEGHF